MPFCQGKQVPSTFVSKPNTFRRKEWFIKNKLAPLIKILQKHEISFVYYPAEKFKQLLSIMSDGVRVYLASYSDEGSPSVPPLCGGLITFVYAPTRLVINTTYVDTGDYYILNPGGEVQRISRALASEWVSNYQSLKLPILTALSFFDPPGKTDSKSIFYNKTQIREILEEMDCQNPTAVKLYLTSYTDDEPDENSQLLSHLTIQYVFMETIDGEQKDFYIDDRPGFYERPGAPAPSFDTGSPSPPASGDGSSLPA